jgi:predicted ATPase
MVLYTATVGQDLRDAIFQVVNQINHGVPELIQEQQLHKKVEISDLNFHAGSRAIDLSDYETANSYLCTALSLLPANHWSTHYEMSLKMYFVAANAAYASGNSKKAFELIKSILEKGRCIEDKLDAYYLYATMLHAREQSDEGYDTCVNVLKQLGETLPATLTVAQLQGIMKERGLLLGRMSDADIQQLKPLDKSSPLRHIMKFYSLLVRALIVLNFF